MLSTKIDKKSKIISYIVLVLGFCLLIFSFYQAKLIYRAPYFGKYVLGFHYWRIMNNQAPGSVDYLRSKAIYEAVMEGKEKATFSVPGSMAPK